MRDVLVSLLGVVIGGVLALVSLPWVILGCGAWCMGHEHLGDHWLDTAPLARWMDRMDAQEREW